MGSVHRPKDDAPLAVTPAGWTAERWVWNLRRMADLCEELHPDLAAEYRRWASELRGASPANRLARPS